MRGISRRKLDALRGKATQYFFVIIILISYYLNLSYQPMLLAFVQQLLDAIAGMTFLYLYVNEPITKLFKRAVYQYYFARY